MYGAILGDMIGAPYEFDRGNKTKEFPLFSRESEFTDDSVMTIAVAEALMNADGKTDEEIKTAVAPWQKERPRSQQIATVLRTAGPLPRTATGKVKRWEL